METAVPAGECGAFAMVVQFKPAWRLETGPLPGIRKKHRRNQDFKIKRAGLSRSRCGDQTPWTSAAATTHPSRRQKERAPRFPQRDAACLSAALFPCRGMCYNRRAVERTAKQQLTPVPPERAELAAVAQPVVAVAQEDASRYCPVCSQRLVSRRCKLICTVCGYYMSCADYY